MEVKYGMVYMEIDMNLRKILTILFAIFETKYWTLNNFKKWVDNIIAIQDKPELWLIEISTAKSYKEIGSIIKKTLINNQLMFDEDLLDIVEVGLLLIKYDNDRGNEEEITKIILDTIDASEGLEVNNTFLDIESASNCSLNDACYDAVRTITYEALNFLVPAWKPLPSGQGQSSKVLP
jgi:hypothetical protein